MQQKQGNNGRAREHRYMPAQLRLTDERLKMHDLKMQDWKMTDHVN